MRDTETWEGIIQHVMITMQPQMRSGFAVLVSLGAGLLPATSGAEDGLSRCARLENIDERLACYDELARATESPSGGPVQGSPRPSYLHGARELGATARGG